MRLLVSGTSWIEVCAIKLYREKQVGEIATARSSAMRKMGAGGPALGVAGTPSWTLAGEAVALSLVSGFLASAAAKEGLKELKKVQETALTMLTSGGEWFSPEAIEHIRIPQPALWRAKRESETFCLNGDEFISIKIETERELEIRWAAVNCVVDG